MGPALHSRARPILVPIHGARAFRWRKLLETGVFATVEEIAAAKKINASYVGRVRER